MSPGAWSLFGTFGTAFPNRAATVRERWETSLPGARIQFHPEGDARKPDAHHGLEMYRRDLDDARACALQSPAGRPGKLYASVKDPFQDAAGDRRSLPGIRSAGRAATAALGRFRQRRGVRTRP